MKNIKKSNANSRTFLLILLLFIINLFLPNLLSVCNITFSIRARLIVEVIITLIMLFLTINDFKEGFKDFKKNFGKNIKRIILVFIVATFVNGLINFFIIKFTNSTIPNNAMLEIFKESSTTCFLISLLITSPIIESIVIFSTVNKLCKSNYIVGILCSASVYGAFYVMFSYAHITQLLFIISYGLFALIIAYSYNKSKNIFLPIGIKILQGLFLLLSFL